MRIRILMLGVLAAALSGCGWLFGDEGYFRDREDDYRAARVTPPMQVPEGLDNDALQDLYVIPPQDTAGMLVGDFEVPRPEALHSVEDTATVRIQKLGEDQWILVENTPSEIWPRVRSFLISNRLGIENERVNLGLLESAWLVRQDVDDRREKYRFRIEQGIQRRSSEIYVKQIGFDAPDSVLPEQASWPETSVDADREEWMVTELANYLAATANASSVSLMAQGLSTASKIYMIRDAQGRQIIDLRLPFDRAWASLGRALQRGEFTVVDLNRSEGRYFVRYEPEAEEEERGFFGRLFGGGDDSADLEAIEYVVQMDETEQGVHIGIDRNDGAALDEESTDLLLDVIRGNLS